MPAVGRAGDVADVVGAGAARPQAEALDAFDDLDRVLRLDLADLQIRARRHMRVGPAAALREIGDAGELPMLQDAVRNAQPAHVGVLRRRDVEQAVIAPAEIVRGLRRLVLLRLLLQPVVGVERMLLALELLLVGELAARRRDAVLRLEMDRVGSGRLALAAGQRAARRARGVEAGDEAFEIAFLVGGEIAGHVTPPIARRGCALGERAAEGEIVADGLDVRAGADQVEIPEPVRGIAEQHRADEAAVRDDELLVDAEAGIGEHDLLGAVRARGNRRPRTR